MAKNRNSYQCENCAAMLSKWAGQCPACGAWDTLEEDAGLGVAGPAAKSLGTVKGRTVALSELSGDEAPPPRGASGIDELDRVLGGGLVPGSVVLIGGDPGAGKSTLAKLLFRFYDVDQGRILVDGIDLRDCQLDSLRQHAQFLEDLCFRRIDLNDISTV